MRDFLTDGGGVRLLLPALSGGKGFRMNTEKHKVLSVKNVVAIAMLAALAAVLMIFLEFPLPVIAPPFYKIDLSEVPVLIGTFAMGPVAGVLIELVKILLKILFKGSGTAYVGELANLVIGCAFLLPAGLIYWKKKTLKRAIAGLALGTVCMAGAGALMNAYVLLPLYAGFYGGMENIIAAGTAVNAGINNVLTFVIIAVTPFNLIKGVIDSVLVMLLYKRVSNLLKSF